MSPKYLIDFDVVVKKDFKSMSLLRNREVFDVKTGSDVMPFMKRFVRIEEATSLGFKYECLDFDGSISEWYELVLLKASDNCNGVTLIYHPDIDEFEAIELEMKFENIRKVEAFVKAFPK